VLPLAWDGSETLELGLRDPSLSASRLTIATELAAVEDAAAYRFFAPRGSPSPHQDTQIRKLCDSKAVQCSDGPLTIVRRVGKDSRIIPAIAAAVKTEDIKAETIEATRDLMPMRKTLHSSFNFYAINSGLEAESTEL
jgi:hypothetical protein